MAANAAEVQRIGKELHDRLRVFGGHLSDVGKGLERAAKSYNAAVGSFEGRILPSARRFDALGVVPAGAEIEAPGAVETAPRLLPSATGESAGEG
jgi:DNA recombination protein RmuC